MIKKNYFKIIVLSIICLFCFVIGFVGINNAFAMKEPVVVQSKLEGTGFNSAQWTADDNGDVFDFVSEQNNYESTVTTVNPLSGSYSVVFSVQGLAGTDAGSIQMVVALGAQEKVGIPLNNNEAYFNTPDNNTVYLGFAGTKVFIFNRDGDYEDNDGGNAYNELGTNYWKHLYNYYSNKGLALSTSSFKFEVVSGTTEDTLNIYVSSSMSFSDTPDCSVTLHAKGVADGYLQFSQPLVNYSNLVGAIDNNSQRIANLKVNNNLVNKADLEVLGNATLVTFTGATKSTLFDSNNDSKIISTFKVDDTGLSNGEEVFSLTYTEKRLAGYTDNHYWGLVFGIDDSGDLSTGTAIKSNKMGFNGQVCVYHCTDNPIALVPFTITVKGYKGGRVEVSYNDYSTCTTHTVVYEDVELNGKVAFKIFDDSGLDGGYWEISNVSFSFSSIMEKDLELKIDNNDNAELVVGDVVKLTTNMECEFDIVEGEEIASLNGDTLTALSVGQVVVKATLVDDDSVSVLFPIQVVEGTNYKYEYKNNFASVQDMNSGKNSSDFYVVNGNSGTISINDNLAFKNTIGDAPVQVGLIVPFTHDYLNDVVFDITFTVTIGNGNKNYRNQNYTCGFAFGLDSMSANPLSAGAGAILINCVKAEIYKDGYVVKPTYVTQNQPGATTTYGSDAFGCYADSMNPLTVRLVAKSDGTLEYYRGIVYKQYGKNDIGTYVTDLFATYSGFDFNGYVSMFTNNKTLDKYEEEGALVDDTCEVKFDDLIVSGNYRMQEDFVPEVTDLGISNVTDLLHTELPIELNYYIYTVPNINAYHGYTVQVVSGNASLDSQNRLVTTGAGRVKLKITSVSNPDVFKEVELDIGELKIDSISLNEDLFKNLTNDSQAFFMNAKLEGVNTYITEYLTICYEVIEGPVTIIDGYLYVNGFGNAKVRVYSKYLPSVEKIVEFNIADADAQYSGGCASGLGSSFMIPALTAILTATIIVLINKSKKKVK